MFAFKVIWWLSLPDIQNVADGFGEHFVAVDAANAQRLGVRFKGARADAEQESAFQQVVHHGRLGRHKNRMSM